VSVTGGDLVVTMDGSALFSTTVAGLPATGLVGFSAATGVHTVSGLQMAY
jgi:hypothetical protein